MGHITETKKKKKKRKRNKKGEVRGRGLQRLMLEKKNCYYKHNFIAHAGCENGKKWEQKCEKKNTYSPMTFPRPISFLKVPVDSIVSRCLITAAT
jgi:hypothetical protein